MSTFNFEFEQALAQAKITVKNRLMERLQEGSISREEANIVLRNNNTFDENLRKLYQRKLSLLTPEDAYTTPTKRKAEGGTPPAPKNQKRSRRSQPTEQDYYDFAVFLNRIM